jgi:hypothetical protein
MDGSFSFKLPPSPAAVRFPRVAGHDGKTHAARPTFESLRFISQQPDGPAVRSFAAMTAEWASGAAPGKSLRERFMGKVGTATVVPEQRAYLIGLRTLLNAEATPGLLKRFTSAERYKPLRSFLDQDDPTKAPTDGKASIVDLSLHAGEVLFNLQTTAKQAFDDVSRAGSNTPISQEKLELAIYAAVNIELDDVTRFGGEHQVRTVSPAPEVSPEVRRMVLGAYRDAVNAALKAGTPLTPALLQRLAAEACEPFVADHDDASGAQEASRTPSSTSTSETATAAMTTSQYAAKAFYEQVDTVAPQELRRGTTEQQGGRWVFTDGFKNAKLSEFMNSLAEFMQEVDENAGPGLVDARLAVFLQDILDES